MTFEELHTKFFYERPMCFITCPHPESHVISDTVLHLPVLQFYASLCDHVTEFGVREGKSTVALLAGARKKLVSYDVNQPSCFNTLKSMDLPCEWGFHQISTLEAEIELTDMLYIDTLHTYDQVNKELKRHADKVKRFIAFHDTNTCWHKDLSGSDPGIDGIGQAILEYMGRQSCRIVYETKANNGLLILEKMEYIKPISDKKLGLYWNRVEE